MGRATISSAAIPAGPSACRLQCGRPATASTYPEDLGVTGCRGRVPRRALVWGGQALDRHERAKQ
jgi:hypothetical protein